MSESRKMVEEKVRITPDTCGTLGDFLARATELVEAYGVGARYDFDYDEYAFSLFVRFARPETDAELARRIKRGESGRKAAKAAATKKKERELAELARLQAKYAK